VSRACEDLLNNSCLGVCVLLDILPLLLSQVQLGARVQIAISGIPAQPVTENKNTVNLGAAEGQHVQINIRVWPFEHPMLKPLRLADAQQVAGSFEIRDVRVFAESFTTSSTSMMGLATNPGTEVEPVCSTRNARSPKRPRILSASSANSSGHRGS
jgi:hypothetical protein